jgi:hypothetical protein
MAQLNNSGVGHQRLSIAIVIFSSIIAQTKVIAAEMRSLTLLPTDLCESNLRTYLAQAKPIEKFDKFSVGVNIGKTNILPATLVRGKIEGDRAIGFSQWLVSYQDLADALKFKVKSLPDGQLEVRTSTSVTRIDLKQLQVDPDIGLVLSIADLDRLFGIKAEFDIAEYAIVLTLPSGNGHDNTTQSAESIESTVNVNGLPRISPPEVALSGIQQRTNLIGGSSTTSSLQGDIAAFGTFWGYSGYIQVNQSDLSNPQTWNLKQVQFSKQTDLEDWTIGSQSPFWRTQTSGEYWGITAVTRHGYRPLPATGSVNPVRLQAKEFSNTIVGEAPPGTLVRLTQGLSDRSIAEVLVDSSQTYRFENIKGSNYRLLLYPNGRLTARPEIRDITLNQAVGQIPVGTSATIWSGGIGRTTTNSSFWGNFGDIRGGVAQRWGVSKDLTLGLGGLSDGGFKGLGELFWQPASVPLQVRFSGLVGDKIEVNSTIDYQPTPSFSTNLSIDRLSTRLRANWQATRKFSMLASYDVGDTATLGAQFTANDRYSNTLAFASFDTASRLRWSLRQRWGLFQVSHQGDEQRTQAQASYDLSPSVSTQGGSSIVSNYETSNFKNTNNSQFVNLLWRYQSPERTNDGLNLWETELGYGIGSNGKGLFVSLGTAVAPGLMLRGRYQGVTNNGGIGDSFAVELVSNLTTIGGIQLGDRRMDLLRSQGGVIFHAFFDRNANGKQDPGEESYNENLDLLISIDRRSIESYRPDRSGDRAIVKLVPGTYRIDLDPAGYPLDWQAELDALSINVVAGTYTSVPIPLVMSFTRSGTVTDASGKAVVGAKVEAINLDRQFRRLSISDANGLYALENLSFGKYRLEVNGKYVDTLDLTTKSPLQSSSNIKF